MAYKRTFRGLVIVSALVVGVAFGQETAGSQSENPPPPPPSENQRPPLVIAEQGSFFVNEELITTEYPRGDEQNEPGQIAVSGMYVEYQIPQEQRQNALPVVMMHGASHTGKTYKTTPDGRIGWAEYFLRKDSPSTSSIRSAGGGPRSTLRRSTRRCLSTTPA